MANIKVFEKPTGQEFQQFTDTICSIT